MSQQPIIRNVTTMDRGPVVRVTTDDVLKAARAYVGEFTNCDIAGVLRVDEYHVRAAVAWLVRRGVVERVGIKKRRLPALSARQGNETYTVVLYRAKEEAAPADFVALNRIFGVGR